MSEKKDDVVETVVEDLMEDPDAPEKGDTNPPQTIENEPTTDQVGHRTGDRPPTRTT